MAAEPTAAGPGPGGRLWEQHPEAMQDALARHDALLSEGCPHLRILPGSPEALGIVGERTYRVPSRTVPDPQRLPPLVDFHHSRG